MHIVSHDEMRLKVKLAHSAIGVEGLIKFAQISLPHKSSFFISWSFKKPYLAALDREGVPRLAPGRITVI